MTTYNSPYGTQDIHAPESALPLQTALYRSQRNQRPICRWCFYGLHPHEMRPATGITEDSQDCKTVLIDEPGHGTLGQCCCTWSQLEAIDAEYPEMHDDGDPDSKGIE